MAKRTCSTPGCTRKHQARGFCSACYSRTFQRGVNVLVPCTACGGGVEKSRYAHKARKPVCSTRCRYFVTYGKWPTSKELVGPIKVDKPTSAPISVVIGCGFVAGDCEWCGAGFVFDLRITGIAPLCCSRRCTKQRAKARHRLANGRFSISRRDRLAIYERDDWTCQLCLGPVDPEAPNGDLWSATLDHIIPQSHMLIPDHSPANLRLAHLWCNSVRGDESYYTADDLVVA